MSSSKQLSPAPTGPPNPISISLSSSKTSTAPSSRKRLTLGNNSSLPQPKSSLQPDSDDDEPSEPVHEKVTGFDHAAGGAIGSAPVQRGEKKLVIHSKGNNDWRRRGKNLLPVEVQRQRAAQAGEDGSAEAGVESNEVSKAAGLSLAAPAKTPMEMKAVQMQMTVDSVMTDAEPPPKRTEDEIALQALLSDGKAERKSNLILPLTSSTAPPEDTAYNETASFRSDVASRPDSCSLDEYAAVPVEEFGAALLRGMGWKEGQSVGRGKYSSNGADTNGATARVPERRPGYLGIGAKDVSGKAGAEIELGAWGKAAMRKNKKGEGLYTPVLMRDKKTGEMITEEELQERKKLQQSNTGEEEIWRNRRDRNLDKSGRDKKEYFQDHRNGYRTDSSTRRDRSRSRDRGDRRRRDDDRDSSRGSRDYRDRDVERERERRHRYRNDDRYDSGSSRKSSHSDRDRYERRSPNRRSKTAQ